MPDLTEQQASELADQTLALKKAIGGFRARFFDTLTPDQRDDLQSLTITLGNEVDHLTAVAIKLSLDELQTSLANLRQITEGVTEAVEHLNDVRKVISVAASLVDLGTAITSGNPAGVLAALEGAVTSIHGK